MGLNQLLTNSPGTYALLLGLSKDHVIEVGKLGKYLFRAGCYVYVGSAGGSGGVRARLKRHWLGRGKLHWHIDYLRRYALPKSAVYEYSAVQASMNVSNEAVWVRKIHQSPQASIPVPGFGATDSAAPSHLFYFSKEPDLIWLLA